MFGAHSHDYSDLAMAPRSRQMLQLALLVQALFLVLEVVGGLVTNSLALLGDAAHMLADVGALGLALVAASLAATAITGTRTWGMARVELLAALVNGATLVLSCAWIAVEAIRRFFSPETIDGGAVAVIAVLGLGANLVTAWLLMKADRDNLNVRAALAHALVDAASSVGVLVAGVTVFLGGPVAVDTIASLLIATLAIRGTWMILRRSFDGLMDAAPEHIDAALVASTLGAADGVTEVHDVHIWETGPRSTALTAHVLVAPGTDVGAAIIDLRGLLQRELDVTHVTLQVAIDRRSETHVPVRALPVEDAIEWAVAHVAARRPAAGAARIRAAVADRASHVPPGTSTSPVRLAAQALRDLR